MSREPILSVDNVTVAYGSIDAIKSISFVAHKGRSLGIVGESGSGKTSLMLAIMRLLPAAGRITSGKIDFLGRDLVALSTQEMREIRGRKISYIPQDPLAALNPVLTVEGLMNDVLLRDVPNSGERRRRILTALERVGMPDPARRLKMYPHQLSGGQRQRVAIAMAVMMRPDLLIADEPTTALDATLSVQIVELLRDLQREIGCCMLVVTHDLGVVERLCDDVIVLRHGDLKESGPADAVLTSPRHDYTRHLIRCDPARSAMSTRRLPTLQDPADIVIEPNPGPRDRIGASPLLSVQDVSIRFIGGTTLERLTGRSHVVDAVKGASLVIKPGETVAVVGESGSGKTTLARAVIGLQPVQSGDIVFNGEHVTGKSRRQLAPIRRHICMMFQDPQGSLSPRMKIRDIIAEPLHIHGIRDVDPGQRAGELLDLVGLADGFANRYPHQLSGGQARRVGIARALALSPQLIVADEPTAGLDVSIQGEVLNLLMSIQDRTKLAILVITHDLGVVRAAADRIVIMRRGEIIEQGSAEQIFEAPANGYTRELIAASKRRVAAV